MLAALKTDSSHCPAVQAALKNVCNTIAGRRECQPDDSVRVCAQAAIVHCVEKSGEDLGNKVVQLYVRPFLEVMKKELAALPSRSPALTSCKS
jgi:hypothetical protein